MIYTLQANIRTRYTIVHLYLCLFAGQGELMSANLGTENYGYMRSGQKASRRKAVGNPQLD